MLDSLKRLDLTEFMRRCWKTKFKKEGTEYVSRSPFREETVASLYVKQAGDGHWVYCDHGNGTSGSIIDAVMAYDHISDVGLGIKRAKQMAIEVGLLADDVVPTKGRSTAEKVLSMIVNRDPEPARQYLIERGIAPSIVEDLVEQKVLVLNQVGDTDYCCFVVKDSAGKVNALFNRKIQGPNKRKQFIIGNQSPFCVDWTKATNASCITICEGIIDALSVLTKEACACVIALPSASYKPERLNNIPEGICLIEAFDQDKAGRAAARKLCKAFPKHQVIPYDLGNANDVNESLYSKSKDTKLSVEDRVAIVLSKESSSALAERYGVHRSRIGAIRKEAISTLSGAWEGRKPGPKPKEPVPPEVKILEKSNEDMQRKLELLMMRIDFLQLESKMWKNRGKEVAAKAKERLRKKKAIKRGRK